MGEIVHQLSRQQGLHQTDKGDTEGARPDNLQCRQVQGDGQGSESRQAAAHRAFIADGGQLLASGDGIESERDNGDQWRRDGLNEARRPEDDKQRQDEQADDQRLATPEVRYLSKENQDPEGIDEPGHHCRGNKTHQARHAAQTKQNLNHTRQNDRRQNVAHAVLMHHRANDQRHRPGGSRHHCRAPAEDRHRQAKHHRGNQADLRVNTGNDRKRNNFRD